VTRAHSNVNPYPPDTLLYAVVELRLAVQALTDTTRAALVELLRTS
jgi:hypothetical protein